MDMLLNKYTKAVRKVEVIFIIDAVEHEGGGMD